MADERKLNGSPSINKEYYYYYKILLSTFASLYSSKHPKKGHKLFPYSILNDISFIITNFLLEMCGKYGKIWQVATF